MGSVQSKTPATGARLTGSHQYPPRRSLGPRKSQANHKRKTSTPSDEEFDAQLRDYKMGAMHEIKLLLLGTDESGKFTLLKQMEFLHQELDNQEQKSYREIIFSNIIQSMGTILQAMPILGIPLSPTNDARRSLVMSLFDHFDGDYLPKDVLDAIQGLWLDEGVKEAVGRSKEFQLNDSVTYYFDAMERIGAPGYLLTENDIINSGIKSRGIAEASFKIGDLTYRIFDVKGHPCAKWFHYFEDIRGLVYVVSLNEYDQLLSEDESINGLQEAITLFGSICNCRWFADKSIILFLNEIDSFSEKLPNSPLMDYFPDYGGGDSYDAACDYILQRFVSLFQSTINRQIYAHFTCASDTQQVKFVLSATQDILLQIHLRDCGLLK